MENLISDDKNYLGIFYSDKSGPKWAQWKSYSKEEYDRMGQIGVELVKEWENANCEKIVYIGGPLGATMRFEDGKGITDIVNQLTVFIVVRAPSQLAATELLQTHPHITHFPCHAVEVMPILG